MIVRIPHLAEGVEKGTVVEVLVTVGETVTKEQTLLEIETKKAVAPIPSPAEGKIESISVQAGDEVAIGQIVMTLSGGGEADEEVAEAVPAVAEPKTAAPTPMPSTPVDASASSEDYIYDSPSGFAPPAAPSVRKMARDLGIDLTRVRGTENGGRIIIEDLRAYVAMLRSSAQNKASAPAQPTTPASIDFSKWGEVTRSKASGLRQAIGEKMSESWKSIPHVTQFDEADITDIMTLRKKYVTPYDKKGVKLTVTSFLIKALVETLQEFPAFNSSLDEQTWEIIEKQYFHLGVAVDTEGGLIVPVIRDINKKSIVEFSLELQELAEKTRGRKIALTDLEGGTFTLSNLGGIGGTYFTPIINKPEVAILGIGRGILKPVVKDKKIEPRMMLPLAVSYDHRVIDGADGARFIRALINKIEDFDESFVKI